MSLEWRGDDLIRKMREASKAAIDETMQEAVEEAKANHPGWQSDTGRAEASVRVIDPAKAKRGGTVGVWGSKGVRYVIFLEFLHGSFLRTAADRVYPKLAARIRRKLGT